MATYMVCDGHGNALTDGLQDHNARQVAQRIANRRSDSVWLSAHGSDDAEEFVPEYTARDLVLCRSDKGDGGWSLHAPGTTDQQIAGGESVPLLSGEAEWDSRAGDWSQPDEDDYRAAIAELANKG